MKQVVSISLGPRARDSRWETTLWGQQFLVRRLGTDGDVDEAARLVAEHDGQVDAIALGGMNIVFEVGARRWVHQDTLRIARRARTTPVVGGRAMRRIVDRWAIRELAASRPELFDAASILVLSGIASWSATQALLERSEHLAFGDPVLHFGAPHILRSVPALERYARVAMPLLTRRPYVSFFPRGEVGEGFQQRLLTHAIHQSDVVVGDLRQLLHHAPKDLRHKVVLTDTFDDQSIDTFRDRGVEVLCATTPQLLPGRHLDLRILHAMAVAHLGKTPETLEDEDYLGLLRDLRVGGAPPRPRVVLPQGEPRRRRKFAYLYYPPGRRELFHDSRLRWMRSLPPEVQEGAERLAARLPIFARSRVTGIVGRDGAEAEGWILHLPATGEQIAQRGDAYAQARLLEASRLARRLGATVLGVGAFSRTMTTATRAVAAKVDMPMTSGASFHVSATLWAVRAAGLALGLEQDARGRARGTCLVFGATDPEGAVAAELLSFAFEHVVLVDRDVVALQALRDRLAAGAPDTVLEALDPTSVVLDAADVVITGLAEGWEGSIDLGALRPGALVCDCARPSLFHPADAARRPDVLFIRTGEIELPGPASLGGDYGPPPKVAFASLAEVVALSLEGRDECFTLGDEVQLSRVKEIYRLGLRHGMRLAGIRGVAGPVRETEVRLVREHAARRRRAAPPAVEVPAPTLP